MNEIAAQIDTSGRLVIPARIRKALGLAPGAAVILRVADGELRVVARAEAVRSAQARVRRYVKAGRSLAGELIAERRAEWRRGRAVLDASAILVLLNGERGAETVAAALEDAAVSAVNLSEVVAKLQEAGMPREEAEDVLGGLGLDVRAFDEASAWAAGTLRTATRKAGLSLGDRACLALARELGVPALTADSAWLKAATGADVRLVR